MRRDVRRWATGLILGLACPGGFAMDRVRAEIGADEAVNRFQVTGKGVLVGILDRGIDWRVNDFKDAKVKATATINMNYDLESIKVGDTCRIANYAKASSFFSTNRLARKSYSCCFRGRPCRIWKKWSWVWEEMETLLLRRPANRARNCPFLWPATKLTISSSTNFDQESSPAIWFSPGPTRSPSSRASPKKTPYTWSIKVPPGTRPRAWWST